LATAGGAESGKWTDGFHENKGLVTFIDNLFG
jgi:hypothetical protein